MFSSRRVKSDSVVYQESMMIENIISINLSFLIQIQNLVLSEYSLIDYPNLKDFRLFFSQYSKKKVMKMYILFFSFFTG